MTVLTESDVVKLAFHQFGMNGGGLKGQGGCVWSVCVLMQSFCIGPSSIAN